ncbi:MAG TPA: uracil-DNA glycosylase [Chthoniobacterales bacterium]|jgi:DNA polymerase|nr:uracil-DNA glycosylase [Chthoniobacterales bacterium]
MQFPSALDLVVKALEQIRDTSDHAPCASRAAVRRLVDVEGRTSSCPSQGDAAARSLLDFSVVSGPSADSTHKIGMLNALRARVAVCTKCPHLVRTRTQTVFGVGNPNAELMFIGEAPGAEEDAQGEPFVGRAGQLLTRIIQTMGLAREDVYIANILKCRPDTPPGSFGNRAPTPGEMQTCRPFLLEQIEIIRPKVIVALGAVAVEGLLGTRGSMRELRGKWHRYNSTPLMITYHPAYLLRNQSPSEKRKVWEDMLQVLERLDRRISEKQRNYFL